jgi:GNAT superfamily N-acetyltransferase
MLAKLADASVGRFAFTESRAVRQDRGVRRVTTSGYELDDDPVRIDRAAVHGYLAGESYWAAGRPRDVMDELIETAARVVGLYSGDGRQVGFARVVSDGHTVSYLADVYVLEEARGQGLGRELVRFAVDEEPLRATKWLLHTRDMHRLYAALGFATPGERTMERWPPGRP